MRENQKRVSLYLPDDLYIRCTQADGTMTELIIQGLELRLAGSKEIEQLREQIKLLEGQLQEKQTINAEELNTQLDEKRAEIRGLTEQVRLLEEQLKGNQTSNVDANLQEIRINELKELHLARVNDLNKQIQLMNEQMQKKDTQIDELNKTLIAQASNIYNLTQTTKLLPEAPGAKKPWWKFW